MGIYDDVLADLLPEMDGDLFDAVENYTFERVTGNTYNESTGQYQAGVEQKFSGRGFYLTFRKNENLNFEVLQGDVKFIITDDNPKPLKSEQITVKGSSYSVVDVITAPTSVVHTYQLRKIGV